MPTLSPSEQPTTDFPTLSPSSLEPTVRSYSYDVLYIYFLYLSTQTAIDFLLLPDRTNPITKL